MVVSSLVGGGPVLQSDLSSDIQNLSLVVWPILVCLLLITLFQPSEHYNCAYLKWFVLQYVSLIFCNFIEHSYILVNDHLPEERHRFGLWGHCSNELLTNACQANHGGIDVRGVQLN